MEPHDIVYRCRPVAGYHLGVDLAERLRRAQEIQGQQAAALLEAADEIERLRAEIATARDAPPAPSVKAEGHASGT